MQTKGAVFMGKHNLEIKKRELEQPGPKDVLIKIMACGVCGTDVHIYEGDKGAADCPEGTTLGHEFSGIVEEVGCEVKGIEKGDRVCVDPNKLCGECYYCKSGIGHFCEEMIGIGTTVHGGFSEYCVVPSSQVYKIADTTSFEEAAMAEPVACCLHGIDMCEIEPGSVVAVIGGGMIGLIMLQLAKLAGAHKLIMIEPVEEKRATAATLGADICINPFEQDAKETLKAMGIHRVNTVIECAGLPGTITQAIDIAGNQSVVMMFGLTKPDETIEVKPFEIFQKEVVLKASFINPYTQSRAVSLIDEKKIDVKSMVCDVIPLSGLEDVLAKPELRTRGKYVVNPQQ